MFKLFKKQGENDCCRYCKKVSFTDGEYTCKLKGTVKASDYCNRYDFNPFAHRTPRVRSLDTTMFDPLDFKID